MNTTSHRTHHHRRDGSGNIEDIDEQALIEEFIDMVVPNDCDDDEDDDEEEDEDVDYSTDESSTASTSSTTNNQSDNTRVCDCCYCEVFGHGNAPSAPTSRNFHEMRERLRRRLSKRQETISQQQNGSVKDIRSSDSYIRDESVSTKGDNTINKGNNLQQNGKHKDANYATMGDSTIEEILNYINGTKKDQKSNTSKRKDKDKNKSNSNNNNHSASNNANKKSKNSKLNNASNKHPKEDKDPKKVLHQNNGNISNQNYNQASQTTTTKRQQHQNHHQPVTDRSTINHEIVTVKGNKPNQDHHHHQTNEKPLQKSKREALSNGRLPAVRKNYSNDTVSSKPSEIFTLSPSQEHLCEFNGESNQSDCGGAQVQADDNIPPNGTERNIHHDGCRSKSIADNMGLRGMEKFSTKTNDQTLSCHAKPSSESLSNNSRKKSYKANSHDKISTNEKELSDILERFDESSLSYVKPEDIFLPRDIDLNDGKLDEFERELEAFKRFCFDSVPSKERVRVHLKDLDWFQETSDKLKFESNSGRNRQHSILYRHHHIHHDIKHRILARHQKSMG